MPDIAVMPREVILPGSVVVGRSYKGAVVVHNIGSADAEDVVVEIRTRSGQSDAASQLVGRVELGRLVFPEDLVAKSTKVEFAWKPEAPGIHSIEVNVSCRNQPEINSRNIIAAVRFEVSGQ
jgi:hypothetical protein